jgi:glycosyltransferase involved in cell wall biosynthesis
MNQQRVRFSIVIPCYNEALFIGRTLESLLNQSYNGVYEIIVVDNNCSDDTAAIAKSYGVKVIGENRPGVCWARQAGSAVASGEIIISTDADTIYPANWLRNIDRRFRANKNYVAVGGPCHYNDGPWWGKLYPKLLFGAVASGYRMTGRPFYITATNFAFKRAAWTGYNTKLTQGGDELELLHSLKPKGSVVFDNTNPVLTSGRRLNKGLTYSLFVSFLLYYIGAYYLNRAFGRTIIGNAPAHRQNKQLKTRRAVLYRATLLVFLIAFIHLPGHDTFLQQSYETFATIRRKL